MKESYGYYFDWGYKQEYVRGILFGRRMICRGNGKDMRFIGKVIEVIMLMEDEFYQIFLSGNWRELNKGIYYN